MTSGRPVVTVTGPSRDGGANATCFGHRSSCRRGPASPTRTERQDDMTMMAARTAEHPAGTDTLTGPAVVVVEVVGDLDLASVARVRETLHDALSVKPNQLVVDLSRCAYVDASALAMLLDVHRRAWRSGGVLTLRGCSSRVVRLLSLTGLRRVFDLEACV
jgi:anti-anti-sigma factor